jgi:phosphotriesterase-related protein
MYGCVSQKQKQVKEAESFIMSVNGQIPAADIGLTLPHEHLFSIFGLPAEENPEYNLEELLATVLPFLQEAKAAGCKTIIDCTAAYFGRNVRILKTLSDRSGLNIITNTGIYGAAGGKYIPQHIHSETAEQIANRWIREAKEGIDGTTIRPGFIKLGVNAGPLTDIDKKLITAGAMTHLATGLTMAVHTTDNTQAAFQQLEMLRELNVLPSAWIWTHAHDVNSNEPLIKAAATGAWISFDGYQEQKQDRFLSGIKALKNEGYIKQILLSHDGNGYPQRGKLPSRLSLSIFNHFLPILKSAGFTQEEINQIMISNPATAYAVKIRKH